MWKLNGRRALGRSERRWNYVKGFQLGGGTDADQDTNQWLALAKMVIIIRIP